MIKPKIIKYIIIDIQNISIIKELLIKKKIYN